MLENQPSKLITKNLVGINDDWKKSIEKTLRFDTTMLNESLWNYCNAYILVQEAIAIAGKVTDR